MLTKPNEIVKTYEAIEVIPVVSEGDDASTSAIDGGACGIGDNIPWSGSICGRVVGRI